MKHSSLQLDLFPPFHLPTSRESCLYFLPSFAHSLLFPQLILFCICLYFAPTYILLAEKAMAPHSSTLCLENPMDRGAWEAAVHGVAKSRTRLSDFTFTFHFPALEKEMATHSSVLAWRIPGTGELGGLPSVGSHRVGHD